jgi:hypothetical protein
MSKAGEQKYPTGKSGTPRTTTAPRFNNAEFVQLELTDDQAKQLKAETVSAESLFDSMERMIDDGYKFTFKYDSYGDCVGVWCQPTDDGSENSGCILTGRGSSAGKAIKQLLFKHHILLQGSWRAHAQGRNRIVLDD